MLIWCGVMMVFGLIVYWFGVDLFFVNDYLFVVEVIEFVEVVLVLLCWFVVDVGVIIDVDYLVVWILIDFVRLLYVCGIGVLFGCVNCYLCVDMDCYGIIEVVGVMCIFVMLY